MHETDPARAGFIRIPLHMLSAAGTTLLLLLVAGLLAWSSWHNTREVISSTVDESTRHVASVLHGRIQAILRPASSQLDLLVFDPVTHARNFQQRLAAVPTALAVLGANPLLDTWFVAYPDGSFVLFRALRGEALRRVFRAPAKATLMVQSVEIDEHGARSGRYMFFDARGGVLREQPRPDYDFEARLRPWYEAALGAGSKVLTEPYVFYTSREVGITIARETPLAGVVVGLDTTLRDIGSEIDVLRLTPGTRVALTDDAGRLIAVDANGDNSVRIDAAGQTRMAWLEDLAVPALEAARDLPSDGVRRSGASLADGEWEIVSVEVPLALGQPAYRLLMAVPRSELFGRARELLMRQWLMIVGLIVLTAPFGYWLTQRIVRPLRELVQETRRMASFDFRPSGLGRSRIAEVDMLTTATGQMRSTIERFLDVSTAINSELRLEALLDVVLKDLVQAVSARSGAIYLNEAEGGGLVRSQFEGDEAHYPVRLDPQHDAWHPAVQAASLKHSVAGEENAGDMLAVPLETLDKEFVGVLVLGLRHVLPPEGVSQRDPVVAFIEALSSTAAVAIETRRLVEGQRELLEAMIQLLAGAIDAKSPYTGGHCQRVPELTRMLAEAADAERSGSLRDFRLTPALREAVHIGAWLHDCGKITTPEHVVDKATKLETIHNRIHEIRTRFEVLKRDVEIAFWKARAVGEPDEQALAALHDELARLDAEFAFVAACNVGNEGMDDSSIERLRRIGARSWQRTLDNRLGLSQEETLRLSRVPVTPLPVTEQLLADRPEQLVPRPPQEHHAAGNRWGFRLEVPELLFNHGELYNLTVRRGTLTAEERYLINEHIVQTIVMLSRLPFPRHLQAVPEIAGGHHERMDGRGYPRCLRGDQMSVPARIIAIADVFEALTASDRPYKPARSLSEALDIMARMAREGHLDEELFALFLRSGIYSDYARRFLRPDQIDVGEDMLEHA